MMTVSHRRSSFKQRSLGAVVALCRPLAVPTQLFLHCDAGERFVGFSGFIGLLVMIAWTFAGVSVFMMLFTGMYVVRLMIYQSACRSTRKHGGLRQHTLREGKPFWGMFSTEDKERERKLDARETALIVVLGLLIAWIDPSAGIFLIASCAARGIVKDCLEAITHERMLDLMDEQIEREEIEERLAKFHPSPVRTALPTTRVKAELFDAPSPARTAVPVVRVEAKSLDVQSPADPRPLLALEPADAEFVDPDAR